MTSPVVIITPMLLDTIDVTIIVAMPADEHDRGAAMRKAFSVTGHAATGAAGPVVRMRGGRRRAAAAVSGRGACT